MKAASFIVLLIIVLSCPIGAQQEKLNIGPKAGGAASVIRGDPTGAGFGRSIGLFTEFRLFKNIWLSIETNKIRLRCDLDNIVYRPYNAYEDELMIADLVFKTDYREFPVLLKAAFRVDKNIQVKPFVGYSTGLYMGHSKRENRRRYTGPVESDAVNIYGVQEASSDWHQQNMLIGCSVYYGVMLFDLRYLHYFADMDGTLDLVPLPYRFSSLIATVGFRLPHIKLDK